MGRTMGAKLERDNVRIGERVRFAREMEGLSQTALAGSVRLSQQMVSKIESGQCAVLAVHLYRIAAATGRNVSWFFDPLPATDRPARRRDTVAV